MFNGRYGFDRLSGALVILAVCVSALGMLVSLFTGYHAVIRGVFPLVATGLVVAAFARALSRNFASRQKELQGYFNLRNRVRAWWSRARSGASRVKNAKVVDFDEHRRYKRLTCPFCGQQLRVPRGKGRLRVTCTKCANRFETRS